MLSEPVAVFHLTRSVGSPSCDLDHGRVTLGRGLPGGIPYGNDMGRKHPPYDGRYGRVPRARLPRHKPCFTWGVNAL